MVLGTDIAKTEFDPADFETAISHAGNTYIILIPRDHTRSHNDQIIIIHYKATIDIER